MAFKSNTITKTYALYLLCRPPAQCYLYNMAKNVIFFLRDTRLLLYIGLFSSAITIPLAISNTDNNDLLNSWSLVLLCFGAFLDAFRPGTKERMFSSPLWMLSIVFYLWLALSYFWDISGGFSIKSIEGYAIFLFIPALFAAIPKIPARKIISVCFIFICVTTLVTIICLIKATHEYSRTHDYRAFYYHYLAQQVGISAIYLSEYCVAAITWLLYFGYIYRGVIKLNRAIVMLWCAYLSFLVFLLSSKMVIFILLVIITFFICYIGYLNKKLWISILILLVMAISGVIAISKLPYLRWRIAVTEVKKYSGEKDDQNGVAVRSVMWKSATELIRQRPFIGYGIRGAGEAMQEKYRLNNFEIGVAEKYNCHNQYLETTVKSGIIGLILFLSILILCLIKAIRQRNLLLIILLFHYMCTSVVESTLEVQRGLIFFFFFIFLFYYHSPSEDMN